MPRIVLAALAKSRLAGEPVLDEVGFEALFQESSSLFVRLAIVICGSDLAEDAVQNAWERAWQRRLELRDASKARAWLAAIVANEARMLGRRHRVRIRIDTMVRRLTPETRAELDESAVDVRDALARLTVEDRTLLALRYVAGYSSVEIAEMLGSSSGVVRVRLSRLNHRLRRDLES